MKLDVGFGGKQKSGVMTSVSLLRNPEWGQAVSLSTVAEASAAEAGEAVEAERWRCSRCSQTKFVSSIRETMSMTLTEPPLLLLSTLFEPKRSPEWGQSSDAELVMDRYPHDLCKSSTDTDPSRVGEGSWHRFRPERNMATSRIDMFLDCPIRVCKFDVLMWERLGGAYANEHANSLVSGRCCPLDPMGVRWGSDGTVFIDQMAFVSLRVESDASSASAICIWMIGGFIVRPLPPLLWSFCWIRYHSIENVTLDLT